MSDSTGHPEPKRVLGGPVHPRDRVPTDDELAAPTIPLGTRQATLRIGSLVIEITGLDDALHDLMARNYAGFFVGTGDEPTFNVRHAPASLELSRSTHPHYLYLPRAEGQCEEARLFARGDDAGFVLWSYFFAGTLDREARRGRLQLCACDDADASQAIENYLRFFVATAALRMGGFLLHSAGFIKDERAWLFFGPSGAGKSTTASHAPAGAVLLGDDLVLVEPWRGSFRACGVPFRGTFQGPTLSTAAAPVAMACRLFQSTENRIDKAPRVVQVAELLGELPFLMEDEELQRSAASVVEKFADFVPVRRLFLTRDGRYWELVAAAGER